jgi:tetratricopeptide (TPR) repeat protein
MMAAGMNLFAADGNGPALVDGKPAFASQTRMIYEAAKSRYAAQTNNAEAACDFGRACYDWADYATADRQRVEIAREGIAACKGLIMQDPDSVAGHYYMGMNLGQVAQTKKLGALKIVSQMEAEFQTAVELDAQYDFAGPDRNLGLLYLEAPGWPLSIGNNAKARQHLKKALQLAPDYPENALNLIEAELKWGEKSAALGGLKDLDELWPKARAKFTGNHWASSWVDWEARRENARKEASQTEDDKRR